jgi:hypothetical protein
LLRDYYNKFFASNSYATDLKGNGAVYYDIDSSEGPGWRASGDCGNGGTAFDDQIDFPSFKSRITLSYRNNNTLISYFQQRSPNFYNSLAPMAPLYVTTIRASGNYSLLGIPAGIRFINPQYYDPGDELVLGTDTWMIFPSHSKDDENMVGFAILKNE